MAQQLPEPPLGLMYAVIFTAEMAAPDADYAATAARLRELALGTYGCVEFSACTEGNREIAISWWSSLEQIDAWRNNPEHLEAQRRGRQQWYRSYRVDVVSRVRGHSSISGNVEPS